MSKQSARGLVRARWVVLTLIAVAAVVFAVGPANSFIHHDDARIASVARAASQPATVTPATRARINANFAALPLAFEANEGQTDPQVNYMARGNGYTLYLTSGDAVLSFASASSSIRSIPKEMMQHRLMGYSLRTKKLLRRPQAQLVRETPAMASVRMHVVGGNPRALPVGDDLLSSKVNYFVGKDPRNWHKSVPEYARVAYRNVYPGVDLTYHGRQNQLEFDFIVAAGANPKPIGLSFTDAKRMTTDESGDLVLTSPGGNLTLHKPVAYQEQGGTRHLVNARFVMRASNEVGFELGGYDRSRELVIDPSLSYASYLGGSGEDVGFGIAVDASGNAYVTGHSDSANFPGPATLIGTGGGFDAFVVKINADGKLGYTTFLGGSGDDLGAAIAVDSSGAVYVAGITTSIDFPASSGAPQKVSGGGTCSSKSVNVPCTDAIAFKLDSNGAETYATYIGGNSFDEAFGIAVDGAGNAYVTGDTFSATGFPLTNALYSSLNNGAGANGSDDAFVAEINAAGTAFVYCTYLGGSNSDLGSGIAVDALGDAFVIGQTISPVSLGFPISPAAYQKVCGTDGNCNFNGSVYFFDAFVTKLLPRGTGLSYSTYLGGSSDDLGIAIALDSATPPNAYVTGQTTNDRMLVGVLDDFPIVGSAFQPKYGGGVSGNANATSNGFVAELNSAGTALVYSSYLGGSTFDVPVGIAVDSSNDAYVTGTTLSKDFPTGNAFQTAISGNSDAFVSEVNPSGSALIYSSYLGGTGDENYDTKTGNFFGGAIAVDKTSGNAYLTGATTSSSGFPVTSGTIVQPTYGGNPFDAFAATVLSTTAPDFTISASAPAAVSPGSTGTSTITLTSVNGYSLAVNLNCSVSATQTPPPTCSSSSFSTNRVTPTAGGATTTLTIQTTGPTGRLAPNSRLSGIFYAMLLPISGMALLGAGLGSVGSRRKVLGVFLLGIVMAGMLLLPACGGSSHTNPHGGTPAGSYTVTVTGTDANNLSHSTSLTLTVN